MKKKINKTGITIVSIISVFILLYSCKDFFNPKQELDITEDELFNDWYEYRSVEMGLYALQQKLVEQIVVLGELRGDLLTVTQNADADLIEINNFKVSKTNKYASPTNFFKLISASNNFLRILEREHPEVLDKKSEITNFDKLYGEALCMRAWAYFMAVRIYGKVPFIPSSLVTMEEVEAYVNSPGTYIDSVYIVFSRDGYYNTDTLYNQPIELEKQYYDEAMVIDYFTNELEKSVKAVGVKHDIDNPDNSWEVTIWNTYAWHALLGTMYLTEGNLQQASTHFEAILKNNSETYRYQLADGYTPSYGRWGSIFTTIDFNEHIFTIWFNKNNFQQNGLQDLFMNIPPYSYKLKPTKQSIDKWESTWMNQVINRNNTNPSRSTMITNGAPGDPYRGWGSSYYYLRYAGNMLYEADAREMMRLRSEGDSRGVNSIMEGMDTIVLKYYTGQYEDDCNFSVYRAGSVQLYMAEIYAYMIYDDGSKVGTNTTIAKGILNDGYMYYSTDIDRLQMGVRGRVGLGSGDDQITLDNIQYYHDPYTNEITGYVDLSGNFLKKQQFFEDNVLEERARELAFEGERFYDLMRIARRRNDPSYLAKRVSAKYPAGLRDEIYNLLLDENNWYIHYFD